jgi:hypothetical protein
LAAVAKDDRRLALIESIQDLHDNGDVGALVVLSRPINIHVAQADIGQAVSMVEGARHRLSRDLGRAVEVGVVEGMVLVHWLLHRVAVHGCRGGVDQSLNAPRHTGFQHVEGATDVYVESGTREIPALQEPKRGEVEYAVRAL